MFCSILPTNAKLLCHITSTHLRITLSLLVLTMCSGVAIAQYNAPNAEDLLTSARGATTLHQPSTVSFRMKATFETFDWKGVSDGKGAVEELYVAGGRWERFVTYRGKKWASARTDRLYLSYDDDYSPGFMQRHLMASLFEPAVTSKLTGPLQVTTSAQTVGTYTVRVENKAGLAGPEVCVEIFAPPERPPATSSEGRLLPAVMAEASCLDPVLHLPRRFEKLPGQNILFDRYLKLGDRYVAGDIAIHRNGKLRGLLHVDELVGLPGLTVDTFTLPSKPPQKHDSSDGPVTNFGGTSGPAFPAALQHPDPTYPPEARDKKISGVVTLHLLVGRDGKVRDVDVLGTPDVSLVNESERTARRYVFAPLVKDGVPREFETTVRIAFSIF